MMHGQKNISSHHIISAQITRDSTSKS